MPARTITAKEVAERLNCTESRFRSKRRKLELDHGFPPKLPGCNAWSEPAVSRWIETNGNSYLPIDAGAEHTGAHIRIIKDAAEGLANEFGRTAA